MDDNYPYVEVLEKVEALKAGINRGVNAANNITQEEQARKLIEDSVQDLAAMLFPGKASEQDLDPAPIHNEAEVPASTSFLSPWVALNMLSLMYPIEDVERAADWLIHCFPNHTWIGQDVGMTDAIRHLAACAYVNAYLDYTSNRLVPGSQLDL